MFPLYAISKPSWRRGPGLVEAEVGVLSFCHSMPLCAKSECCDDLGGFPLHRRAWNSVTIKQGLAATGDFEILAGTGLACRSISSVFPARWLGRLDRSRVCQAEVLERSRCDHKAVASVSVLVLVFALNATPGQGESTAAGGSNENGRTVG